MAVLPNLNVKTLTEMINIGGVEYFQTHNVLLYGKQGIGKSEIMKQVFKNHPDFKNHDIHVLMLGQMSDVGDILGLPREVDGHTTFVPPYWWPTGENARPIVLIMDELNRGRPELLQCAFDLTLNKTVAGRSLPAGSVVIAAGNLGEEFQVNDLDPALNSRFDIYEFKPSVDEWLSWATEAGLDKRVTTYIGKHNSELERVKEDTEDAVERTPDRRSWVRVSDFMKKFAPNGAKLQDTHATILAGIIGLPAAGMFKKFCDTMSGVSPEALFTTDEFETLTGELSIMTLSDLIYLADQSILWMKGNKQSLTESAGAMALATSNLLSFLRWCEESSNKEVIGNMVKKLQSTPAVAYFIKNAEVRQYLTNYIMTIKM